MEQATQKTAGSYSTFVAMCSELEARIIDHMQPGVQRDDLLRRTRLLRREFESWPTSPPEREQRCERWMELCGLEQAAEQSIS